MFAVTLLAFTVAGRESVYTPVVALELTDTWLDVPTTFDIKFTPNYGVCGAILIE